MMRAGLFIATLCCVASLYAGTLADPTQPLPGGTRNNPSSTSDGLQLNATYVGNDQRYAIINGVKLREGESHGNLRLKRIRHKSVDITLGDRELSLPLNHLRVKTQ